MKTDYFEAWNNRGKVFNQMGRHLEALASFEKALTLDPNDADTWKKRGVLLGVLVRYSEAVASYDTALTINPNDADAWCSRGILLQYLNQDSEAKASFDKALSIDPKHERARDLSGREFAEDVLKYMDKILKKSQK